MTKEELEKEAEEKAIKAYGVGNDWSVCAYKNGYLAGAEPREKRIAELEDKLANADYQLEGRDLEIRELKEQIKKMKCCFNCKHSRTEYEHCTTDKHEKWEIKEK